MRDKINSRNRTRISPPRVFSQKFYLNEYSRSVHIRKVNCEPPCPSPKNLVPVLPFPTLDPLHVPIARGLACQVPSAINITITAALAGSVLLLAGIFVTGFSVGLFYLPTFFSVVETRCVNGVRVADHPTSRRRVWKSRGKGTWPMIAERIP